MPAHPDVVRREFERQADGFGHRGSFFAAASTAAWIDEGARLAPDDIVLDAGGGAGDVVHHLADPAPALAELARGCRPGGRVVLADLVAVDDEVAERHNALERLRDPSRTTALTADGLVAALAATGLAVGQRDTVDRAMDLEPWIERAHTPAGDAERIRAAMAAEMAGAGPPTGLRPARRADGVVRIEQRWVRLVGRPA